MLSTPLYTPATNRKPISLPKPFIVHAGWRAPGQTCGIKIPQQAHSLPAVSHHRQPSGPDVHMVAWSLIHRPQSSLIVEGGYILHSLPQVCSSWGVFLPFVKVVENVSVLGTPRNTECAVLCVGQVSRMSAKCLVRKESNRNRSSLFSCWSVTAKVN